MNKIIINWDVICNMQRFLKRINNFNNSTVYWLGYQIYFMLIYILKKYLVLLIKFYDSLTILSQGKIILIHECNMYFALEEVEDIPVQLSLKLLCNYIDPMYLLKNNYLSL